MCKMKLACAKIASRHKTPPASDWSDSKLIVQKNGKATTNGELSLEELMSITMLKSFKNGGY